MNEPVYIPLEVSLANTVHSGLWAAHWTVSPHYLPFLCLLSGINSDILFNIIRFSSLDLSFRFSSLTLPSFHSFITVLNIEQANPSRLRLNALFIDVLMLIYSEWNRC